MEFKQENALMVIEEMINKTKEDLKDNGFYFSLWGWLVLIAALSNYYLLVFTDYMYHSLPWMILMPAGGIFTMLWAIKERKKTPQVKTYVGEVFKYVGQAFAFSLFIICFLMPMGNQWAAFYPTIMVIYALWLYVSGGVLKFKPLMAGALLNWLLAGIGFIWKDTEVHLLLISLAVLGGYIIPGYLLTRKFRQQHV